VTIQGTMRPILVIGAARSGTSAIGLGLIKGAGLPGYNEGHVLPLLDQLHQVIDKYLATFDEETLQDRTYRLVAWIDPGALKDHMTSWFIQFMEERLASEVWVDKTPDVHMIMAVPRIAAIFPQARFVFAHRRGIENVLSRTVKWPDLPFETHCRRWEQSMDRWLRVRADLPPQRYIQVEQLDIALHPEETAERMGSFLGLSREHIDGISGMWLSERPEQSRASQDYRYIGLNETGWSDEERALFVRVCGPSMEHYGYSLEGQVFPKAFQRSVSLYYPIAGGAAREISMENVAGDGFRPVHRGFLLHPNRSGTEPARVRYRGLEFFGHNHFSASLRLNHPASVPVEYRLVIERSGDRAPACDSCIEVSAGPDVQWELPLPTLHGAYDVVISTSMTADAASDHQTGAIWKQPQFRMSNTA